MNEIVSLTIMGVMATAAMNCFLWLITGLTKTNVDMVKAVGSIYTKSASGAMIPGLIMQFTSGTMMAYVYGVFLRLVTFEAAYGYALLAIVIGLIHGIIVAVILASLLAEHHPVAEYQEVDRAVAFYHVIAHAVYGLIIGSMWAAFI